MEEPGRPRLPWKQEFAGSNPAYPTIAGEITTQTGFSVTVARYQLVVIDLFDSRFPTKTRRQWTPTPAILLPSNITANVSGFELGYKGSIPLVATVKSFILDYDAGLWIRQMGSNPSFTRNFC